MQAPQAALAPLRILFVNGINTAFGGSGRNLMSAWLASLRRTRADVTVIETVPSFGIRRKGAALSALWAAYFLPGTLFRLSRFPGFEMLVKLSPLLALRILKGIRSIQPALVVFSHHSTFLYSLFVQRNRRVFIIHDLLYARARSMGYPKVMCKVLLNIECRVYGMAEHLVALSHTERRILERFVGPRVSLTSCLDKEEEVAGLPECHDRRIALVSDWRRHENLHGLLTFFSGGLVAADSAQHHEFVLYGYDSAEATRKVTAVCPRAGYVFTDGGTYSTFTDIQQVFFLVPIYLGAGIKRKTLETLQAGRYVLGTPAAFIGLRRSFLSGRSLSVASPRNIVLPDAVPLDIGEAFASYYFQEFADFGELLVGFLEPSAVRRPH